MRDKWKEPILKNTEDQFAWTMAYDTGCGPLDLFISGLFQAGKYIVFVLLTMYVNMKNARNEKRLHSTTGQPADTDVFPVVEKLGSLQTVQIIQLKCQHR